MSNPLISIIVPVYKVEPYLSQCIDSLTCQTYSHLEIILVDDGSPDNCGKICDEYAAADDRIKVIHQANRGVSAARNAALAIANGEYVMFVDGDDWTDAVTCETAVKSAAEHGADVVMWTYMREYAGHSSVKSIFPEEFILFDKMSVAALLHRRFIGLLRKELSHPENADALCPIWGKLYRRKIIQSPFIDLAQIGTYEDGLFNLNVFADVDSAVFINKPMYHYRKTNSTSLTSTYKSQLFTQWQHLFDLMETYIAAHDLPADYTEALYNRIALSLIGLGLNIMSADVSARRKMQLIREILSAERYREAYKRLKYQYLPLHWKVFFICAKFRFSGGVYSLLLAIQRIISK